MEGWLPDLSGFPGPKYRAIAEALAGAIRGGDLKSGDRLPPQRDLASRLGCDLTTVTRGYELARQRGLIVGRGRAGSFVRDVAKASLTAAQQIDTGLNTPPIPPGGVLQSAYSDALQSVFAAGDISMLQYQGAGGSFDVRRAGALRLSRLGLPSARDEVVIAGGGQNALHAIIGSVAKRGDVIACGRFVYPGLQAIAQRQGIELEPLAEMTGAALQNACRVRAIKALYLVPTNDNPTTHTVPRCEREQIARVARLEGIQIIEDDAYGLLAKEPLPPTASFAPELSWYIMSTSKIISPTLRVAFVKAPGVGPALQLAAGVHETAVMAPPLSVAVISSWLADGTFDKLISAVRSEAAWRLKTAASLLGEESFDSHPQGYHLWLRLPGGVIASELSRALSSAGIGAIPSDRFAVGPCSEQALRVSLGGVAERQTLEAALRSLEGHVSTSTHLGNTVI